MSNRNVSCALALACSSLLGTTVDVSAQSRAPGAPAATPIATGKIVFRTSLVDPDGTVRGSRLLRVSADGSALHPLMPMVAGVFNGSPTWSPGGGMIAFERFDTSLDRTDIFLMDSQGRQLRRLTDGAVKDHTPSWGPGGIIAFVSDDGLFHTFHQGTCLSTIRSDGSQQQHLFCPGVFPVQHATSGLQVSRPVWTADGASILIEGGYYGGLTTESWYSAMYKVDVKTGAATMLGWQERDKPQTLSFSPRGTDALYWTWDCPVAPPCSSADTQRIYRYDFASQQSTPLVDGYAPLYSHDGGKVAFTRTILDATQPGVPRYDQVFVMDADGSNVRQLTATKVDNIEYLAADWSGDGTKILVNRTTYTEEDGRRVKPKPALRIIDLESGAIDPVVAGYAYSEAWFPH